MFEGYPTNRKRSVSLDSSTPLTSRENRAIASVALCKARSKKLLSYENFSSAQVCESPYDFTSSEYKALDCFQEHNKSADSHCVDRERSFCRRAVLRV